MPQKILIISAVIFPRLVPRAHRATELAKELSRQGHDVTLAAILGKYDYTSFQEETGIKVKDLGMSGFQWINSDPGHKPIALWRKAIVFILRRWLVFPDILIGKRTRRFLKNCGNYDRLITIAIPYPIHWGAAYAKRHYKNLKNTVWISDCGDPFMGNPLGGHPFYFKYVEKWWCRTTDFISVPTEIAIQGYYPEFRDKICVIPQGFVFDSSILADYKKNAVPTFAYSGMVYPQKRDPRKFLNYLVERNDSFKFVVYTNKPDLFMPYKAKLGEKLEFRAYVPHEQLLHELSKMDFLINIRNESAVQTPSKLIDYYLTHRPILEITSAFEEKDVFEAFCREDYQGQVVIENPERYDIKNVAKIFAEL
jgi:hypothetical protein